MHREKQLEDGDEVVEGLREDDSRREKGVPAGGRGRAGITRAYAKIYPCAFDGFLMKSICNARGA